MIQDRSSYRLVEDAVVFCMAALASASAGAQTAPLSGVTNIVAGFFHTCASLHDGSVRCWGYGGNGQLGDGSREMRLSPVKVAGLPSPIRSIASGQSHVCALASDSQYCWGHNYYGQVGDGTTTDRRLPTRVASSGGAEASLALGGGHSCAVSQSGEASCWGDNRGGQLGDGTAVSRGTPAKVVGPAGGVKFLIAGGGHTCALAQTGNVYCWGVNNAGQTGVGDRYDRWTPTAVVGLDQGVYALGAGNSHTCAIMQDGSAKCWGLGEYGQLGDGTKQHRLVPVEVLGLSEALIAIVGGQEHTCALTAKGSVQCWGANGLAQLGDPSAPEVLPHEVPGMGSGVVAIAAGSYHTCALTNEGIVKCWGDNMWGQLGDGSRSARFTPAPVLVQTPGAPDARFATGGNAFLSIHFTMPASDGGANIVSYRALCEPGEHAGESTASPVIVSGLTNGIEYACRVAARNAVGWGQSSAQVRHTVGWDLPGWMPGAGADAKRRLEAADSAQREAN